MIAVVAEVEANSSGFDLFGEMGNRIARRLLPVPVCWMIARQVVGVILACGD